MSTPFKMNGFSGFGNSPLKQDEKKAKAKELEKRTKQTSETRARLEKELNVNPETDTLVEGMSIDQATAQKKAHRGYEVIFPDTFNNRPPSYHSRDVVHTNRKVKPLTGKGKKFTQYSTWVKGKKSN